MLEAEFFRSRHSRHLAIRLRTHNSNNMAPDNENTRVIGDVHGHVDRLRAAAGDADRIMLLGDLVDRGPDSAGVIRLALDWMEQGRAQLVRSNHDDKLYRFFKGRRIRMNRDLSQTIRQINDAKDSAELRDRFMKAYAETPHIRRTGHYIFAHAAISSYHFAQPEHPVSLTRMRKRIEQMALFGEINGARDEDGKPIRMYDWVDDLPAHVTAVVGHDCRADQPFVQETASGARAIFLDTGCGKGGPLSWIDLPTETIGQVDL